MATLGLSEAEREAVARLERDVIEPSMTSLVLLDFWAEWCGPCKQLGPLLEKVAAEYADKGVKLVKIDVEADKFLAAQFRVQSVPTVYAFHRGQPVADLTNYRSESQLKHVLDQLIAQFGVKDEGVEPQADIAPLVAMGEQVLAEGDASRAVSIFRQLAEMAPEQPAVAGGLIRALVAAGDLNEARALLDSLPEALAGNAEIGRAKATLELAQTSPPADISDFEARLAANPDDHEARFELAAAKSAGGDRDGAADALLEIISRDREWNDGAARQRLLQLLEAQGLEDPWGRQQRRRLSALLFT